MSAIWNASNYDSERRRLIPCFDDFYGSVGELIARHYSTVPRMLDLGAGTGIVSASVVARVSVDQLTLLDQSAAMLERAATRLVRWHPELVVQELCEPLPSGPFDVVVSALAIHHLRHDEQRELYARIFEALASGGMFIHAEQVNARSARLCGVFEAIHLDVARNLGSSETEIHAAIERMKQDRCTTVTEHLAWLTDAGYDDIECFYRSFRFAVFGGWKP